ncbi:hypothetical protein AALP_AA6G059700 [Arabis alpina]|uniref:Uncharacterized protein n=1 Tax=Arabis alpina TaxID=50452 RepID=A0A087GMD5_ARAAL|nr:hypothetical protein AALP_AA6G059700 [Arabis alpina]
MTSESSVFVKLDRKQVRRDPDVTLAHASDHSLSAAVPTGIPLVGPSNRRLSGASSPEVELPHHRPEVAPPQGTGPSDDHPVLDDSREDGSSNVQPKNRSRGSDDSDRIDTDQDTSSGDKGSLVNFRSAMPKSLGPGLGHGIMLSDCNDIASSMDSSMVYSLSPTGEWDGISIRFTQTNDPPWNPPEGYMCVYECFIKNGWLCFPIPKLLLQYCHRRRIAISQLTHGSILAVMAVRDRQHWPLLHLPTRRVPARVGTQQPGDFCVPLEDNSPEPPSASNKKKDTSRAKKKNKLAQTQLWKDPMVKLNLDVVDFDEELKLPKAAVPAEREGLRPEKVPIAHGRGKGMMGGLLSDSCRAKEARLEKERQKELRRKLKEEEKNKEAEMLAGYNFLSDAWYASDQKNPKLNTQNGELVVESSRLLEARRKAEQEVVKFKDLLDHCQRMNSDLIAEQDVLNSRVADLTSTLVEAEEMKKKEVSRVEGEVAELKSSSKDVIARAVDEVKKKTRSKLKKSLAIMEERSRAQAVVERLASLARQVVGAIRRMEKAAKDRVLIDAAKKEKLEACLAGSDDEAERTEVDGRLTVAGKTPALTRAEIEEVANDEAEDEADRLELQGREGEGATEQVGVEERPEIEVVDAATGEPIVPLFSQREADPEDKENTPYIACDR